MKSEPTYDVAWEDVSVSFTLTELSLRAVRYLGDPGRVTMGERRYSGSLHVKYAGVAEVLYTKSPEVIFQVSPKGYEEMQFKARWLRDNANYLPKLIDELQAKLAPSPPPS